MEYNLKGYIKLLCIEVNNFESKVIDEKNTDSPTEIERFVDKYKYQDKYKILIIQMSNMSMITFDEMKRYIRKMHVFDYVRHLLDDGNSLVNKCELEQSDKNNDLSYIFN